MKERFSLLATEDLIAQATQVKEIGEIRTSLFKELIATKENEPLNTTKAFKIECLLRQCSNKITDILNQK